MIDAATLPPPPDWTHRYADGNNNTYYIAATTLVYSPISALQSSSGYYSGGQPATLALTSVQYQAILLLFEQAKTAVAAHQDQRTKFTSVLHFRALHQTILLAHQTDTNQNLQKYLNSFVTKQG